MTDKKEGQLSAESVEVQQNKVAIPGLESRQGMIKTTFSLPPYKPELRVRIHFFSDVSESLLRHTEPTYFILSSKKGAQLLSAVFKKAAEVVDKYAESLPDKEI
jgi:hypothetical protein